MSGVSGPGVLVLFSATASLRCQGSNAVLCAAQGGKGRGAGGPGFRGLRPGLPLLHPQGVEERRRCWNPVRGGAVLAPGGVFGTRGEGRPRVERPRGTRGGPS